jgi:two-component system sensor histidine kinase KdpD
MAKLIKRLVPKVLPFLGPFLCVLLTKVILQPAQSFLEIQIIELIYLLPVLLATVLWGLTSGIMAGITAFLVFNFFYIQPYETFMVHQTQDVITLIIFLFVAILLSRFIGKAREGMRLARNREWEATRMYELISELAGLKDMESIARQLAAYSIKTFILDCVEINIECPEEDKFSISIPEKNPCSTPSTHSLVLKTARSIEGEMRIWKSGADFTPQEDRLLQAFISQGALAFERLRLMKGENMVRILAESDQMKTSLLNSVSHELRTPLSVIKASVSSLHSGTVKWETDARRELLATIEEETDQLNLLVGNLLDMSRIEAGALAPQKDWNAIDEIAISVAAKMRKQLINHHLEMIFAEDLPLIHTDYVMIAQVFINLISNSIKYSPDDSTIVIEGQQAGEFIHIKLSNQGPQVSKEHLLRIFDKFYRVTNADQITGTGLGLSICKGIIEAHGGKIWAENENSCFVFHFILPVTLDGTSPSIPREILDE